MAPKLYMINGSAPVRSVLITAAAIGLELENVPINILKGEHKTPEFLKLNPQHTVPTLVDGDYVLWDSHAIIPYLVDKYGNDDSLYPKDLKKRCIINQRLFLNSSSVYGAFEPIMTAVLFRGEKTIAEDKIDKANELYALLNTLLERTAFIADDNVTIADFSMIAALSAFNLFVRIDEEKYPKLYNWYNEMLTLPCYEASVPGYRMLEGLVKMKLGN